MCIYSAERLPKRRAVVGDVLLLMRFDGGAVGFREADGTLLVCLPRGTKMLLAGIPKRVCHAFHIKPKEEVVTDEFSSDRRRHDILVFTKHGDKGSALGDLGVGHTRAVVISLPLVKPEVEEAAERVNQERGELVEV